MLDIKENKVEVINKAKTLYDVEKLDRTKVYANGDFRGRHWVIGKNKCCNPVAYVELKDDEVKMYMEDNQLNDVEDLQNVVFVNDVNGGLSYSGKAYWDISGEDHRIYVGWDYGHSWNYDPNWNVYGRWEETEVWKASMIDILMEIGIAINEIENDVEGVKRSKFVEQLDKRNAKD